jgi:molecular chaperone DnaK
VPPPNQRRRAYPDSIRAVTVEGGYVPVKRGLFRRKLASSVGIETRGGVLTPLISRGARVPCDVTEGFTTADDNQPSIKVSVFHGVTGRVADAQQLGRFELLLGEALPSGVPNIRVTFAVGADGRFRISAHDVDRGEVRIAVS